jgi:phosphocarrier protein HPr
MPTTTLIIRHERGLDARHAVSLIQTARRYAAHVTMSCGCRQADAASITALLALGCTQGTPLTIHAEGEEAEQALGALEHLIVSDFGSVT